MIESESPKMDDGMISDDAVDMNGEEVAGSSGDGIAENHQEESDQVSTATAEKPAKAARPKKSAKAAPKVAKVAPKAATVKPVKAAPKAAKVAPSPSSAPKVGGLKAIEIKEAVRGLKAAADSTRATILGLLVSLGEVNVTDLCRHLQDRNGNPMGQPAVSHHLALLRHGRFVEPRRDGKSNYYSATVAGTALWQAIHLVAKPDA